MIRTDAIRELALLTRSFGPENARRKAQLLAEIARLPRVPVGDIVELTDALETLRAYPDDARVRDAVGGVVSRIRDWVDRAQASESPRLMGHGVPGSVNRYPYSYAVLQHFHRKHPGSVEIDWDAFEDQTVIASLLELLFTAPENETAEYLSCGWDEWVARTRSDPTGQGLGFFLKVFERSGLSELAQAGLFELCGFPIRYDLSRPGLGRSEVELRQSNIVFQATDFEREHFALGPEIEKPLRVPRPLARARAEEVLDVCLRGLCARELEIHPLIYASADDVLLFSFERGIQIVLAGVQPEHRAPLGASYFFMVLKNGVPMAYGPSAPLFGACELGINLFPQFRGGEIRYIYAQFMRVLHHVLGVELFYLTRYGMGEDNPDAIASGAFWFYRKLGFVPTNPKVEKLAREEEARMRSTPGHRSDVRMLHRLSHTEAVLDLSGGKRRPFDFAELGLVVARAIAEQHDGDRPLFVRRSSERVRRSLGIGRLEGFSEAERRALDALSPVLALLPELPSFSAQDKARVTEIIRGKARASEARATRALAAHPRLERALRALVEKDT